MAPQQHQLAGAVIPPVTQLRQQLKAAPVVAPDQPSQIFSNLLFAAALTCHAPLALVAIAEPGGGWRTLSYGIPSGDVPPDNALYDAIGVGTEPLEIVDLLVHPELADTNAARGPLGIRSVYGVPLRAQGSGLLGVLCVFDRGGRRLSAGERRGMSAIAGKIADRLALGRRTDTQLPPVRHLVEASPRHPGYRDRSDQPDRVDHGAERHPAGAHRASLAGGDTIRQRLLGTNEVATLFGVTSRTVVNWAIGNRLPSIRTPGGQLRFELDDVDALLARRGRP